MKRYLLFLLTLVLIFLASPKIAKANWYDDDWLYRILISCNNTASSENLTNFPVVVYLTADNFTFSHAQPDGDDILCIDNADNTTVLNYEKEHYDSVAEEAWLHVNMPHIAASSKSSAFWLYYGNEGATDGQHIEATWNDNFTMIQHMTDNTTTTIVDSTSNDNDGTKTGAGTPEEVLSNIVDGAQLFDGSPELITCGSNALLNIPSVVTMEVWVEMDSLLGEQWYLMKRLIGGNYVGWDLLLLGEKIALELDDGADSATQRTNNNVISNGGRHYVAATLTLGSAPIIYIDGTTVASSTIVGNMANIDPISNAVNYEIGGRSSGSSRQVSGTLDEIRMSNIVRSADWIEATYLSGTYGFLVFSPESGYPLAPTNFVATPNGNNIDLSWTIGVRATHTTIVRGDVQYPTGLLDGIVAYNGTGTTFTDLGAHLDEGPTYYLAISYSDYGYGDSATTSTGGEGVISIAVALILLGLGAVAFWKRSPDQVALTAVLFGVNVIGWLFGTFYFINLTYPSDNAYLPYAMGALGLSITLVMAIQVYIAVHKIPEKRLSYQERKARALNKITQNALKGRRRPWYEF